MQPHAFYSVGTLPYFENRERDCPLLCLVLIKNYPKSIEFKLLFYPFVSEILQERFSMFVVICNEIKTMQSQKENKVKRVCW